jgi:hypothetical protein
VCRCLVHGLKLRPFDCIRGICDRKSQDLFAVVVPGIFSLILWRYAAIGTDVVYVSWVIALIVTVAIFWSFV